MPRTGRPPIEQPKSNRITIRVDESTMKKLKAYCDKTGKSLASAIREAIDLLTEK
jgi:predicted DNA-binding protein